MRYALTPGEMRAAEQAAVESGAQTLAGMMERAGVALAAEVASRVPLGPVVVLAGPGNNGGDGWVAARILHEAGREVCVLAAPSAEQGPREADAAAAAALGAGVPRASLIEEAERAGHLIDQAAVAVDAIFGFGFRGAVGDPYAWAIERLSVAGATVIAADIPSGVHADTGIVLGPAVRADVTVTFSAMKRGLLILPGAEHSGEIVVAEVGVPHELLAVPGALEVPSAADLRTLLPTPSPRDHKGSRGRVGVIAGSATYPGAAVLAVEGALRLGAGYVVAVVPAPIGHFVTGAFPNALVRLVPASTGGAIGEVGAVLAALADVDAAVVGPGLTTDGAVSELVTALLERFDRPLLVDADALNVLAGAEDPFARRTAPLVISPHPGEAVRLVGATPGVTDGRVAMADALADLGTVCLLKGAGTIVSGGGRRALIRAGNAGLARAGSGDVLSGMIATLLAQGVDAFDAAVLGAHLHGRAADFGTSRLTQTCFTSADIAGFLPDAVREVSGG